MMVVVRVIASVAATVVVLMLIVSATVMVWMVMYWHAICVG